MSEKPPKVTLSLDAFRVPLASEDDDPHFCRRCELPLDIDQPDADAPQLLLGTCPGCRLWHAIGIDADGEEALVVVLPLVELIRDAEASRISSTDGQFLGG